MPVALFDPRENELGTKLHGAGSFGDKHGPASSSREWNNGKSGFKELTVVGNSSSSSGGSSCSASGGGIAAPANEKDKVGG